MNLEEKYNALNALIDGYRRERDEAQKEAARLKRWIYRTRKESLENKGEEITDDPASLLHSMFYEIVDGRVDRLDSFRRGAEAMRLACQQWCRAWENDGEAIADALADLRVEDKP